MLDSALALGVSFPPLGDLAEFLVMTFLEKEPQPLQTCSVPYSPTFRLYLPCLIPQGAVSVASVRLLLGQRALGSRPVW